jgi:Leucine-rich repeat (LRR) protein
MTFDVVSYIDSLSDDVEIIVIENEDIEFLPDLSRFKKLKRLDVTDNMLTKLPPLNEPLEILKCGDNLLTNLPEFPKSLKYVYCEHNKITVLPNLNELKVLGCCFNELTQLPPLPSTLEFLSCGNNLLTELPELNEELMICECGNNFMVEGRLAAPANRISSLPKLNKKLEHLRVENMKLETLPELNENLLNLDCDDNCLTRLPKLNKKLEHLSCTYNYLTQLPDLNPDMDVFCKWNPLIYPLRIRGQTVQEMLINDKYGTTITIVNTINRFRFAYYSFCCTRKLFYKCVRRRLNVYRNELLEKQAQMMYSPCRIERLLDSGLIQLGDDAFDVDF